MFEVKKKCDCCKRYFDIVRESPVFEKNKFYHFGCYVDKKLSMKRNKLSREELEVNLKEQQTKTFEYIKKIIDREKLLNWISKSYNIVSMPTTFIYKLDSILDGTREGLIRGINAEDILDMWISKKSDLDRIFDSNKRKGKDIDKPGRLSYDLSILVNKYDDYLEWKESEKTRKIIENEQIVSSSKIEKIKYENLSKPIVEHKETFELNINDILNEI